jgi:hypothetical protein
MKLNRFLLITAALCFTATAATFAASAHLGTWKLDESKSTMPADSPKNKTVTYTEANDGMVTLTVDGVDKDGKPIHWTWKGKFDGKQYKVEGSPAFDSVAYKAKNDHTNSATGMKEGKVVFTGTIKVAKDGKSRMVTTTMTGADGKKHTSKAYYTKE